LIQSIDRAAQVLSSLQGARHLGITELSGLLGLPPSTVHGIVKSLRAHGLVAKEPNGNRYMLGPALLKLSNVYLDTLDVRARAMRWTQELAKRTGLATRLGAELFDEVIIIHHNNRPDGTEQMPETGLAIPVHSSAMGKILLTYNADAADQLFEKPLRSLTGDTITDPAKLILQFAQIAERGIATEEDESVLGESSIAAPIADRDGSVIAAVAVVMPSSEWPPEDNVLNVLRETARNISRELGFTAWPPPVVRRPAED
jgi:DNA-binding IclR family transcriptional regulator